MQSNSLHDNIRDYLKAVGLAISIGLVAAVLVRACIEAGYDEGPDAAVAVDAGAR